MNLLLADVSPTSWILVGVLALFLIAYPFIMRARNKREVENQQKLMGSIKKGDKILTYSGVIGKVVSLDEKDGYKTVTIETGDEKHKGYMTVDIAAVYSNLTNPVLPEKLEKEVKQEQVEQQPEVKEEPKEENLEPKQEEVKEEPAKKSNKSKKSKSKK